MLQQPMGRLDAPLHIATIGNGQPLRKNPRITYRCSGEKYVRYVEQRDKTILRLCEEQGLPTLAATAATIAPYIAWIGE
jgi:crotonobetainyl-CoA:carnitine CoA-transferase CaiB-like acyl-CoA transferase